MAEVTRPTVLRLVARTTPSLPSGAQFLLSGADLTLGRDPGVDLVLDSPTVSGRHGRFRLGPHGTEFTDLGSRNGSAIARDGAPPAALRAGEPVLLRAGDLLLLGDAEAPVHLHVEETTAPFEPGPDGAMERTVLASAPLTDLRDGTSDVLATLAARALVADRLETLARAALAALTALAPRATGHAVLLSVGGAQATAGERLPSGLLAEAQRRGHEVALLGESTEQHLPSTRSIATQGMRRALIAPLVAGRSWVGALAVWSDDDVAASLPQSIVTPTSVAASLVGLATASLGARLETERARRELEAENARLKASGPAKDAEDALDPIGSSPTFLEAVALCRTVAPATVPVLLLGETGTGKEVLAKALHRWSARSRGPFVAFNCAAVPETLIESELFGYVRGAFTGANTDRKGFFEEADRGTIFLDEIGEMPAAMQAKLLRVLQDGEVRRVGASKAIRVDVRVISATHRDLRVQAEQGLFRADLMYRLNAVSVKLPPLRERGDDVTLLAHFLLARTCKRYRKRLPGFTPEALWALTRHDFPGNVRELENEVVRAVALSQEGEPVATEVFSEAITQRQSGQRTLPSAPTALADIVANAERQAIEHALFRSGGNVSQAARDLGLTRPGLYKVMERLGLRG